MKMEPAFLGWLLGLGGAAVGVAGGIFGTYASIRNTHSARERAFVIRASAVLWAAITVFVLLMFLVPDPYRLFLWIPYGLALPVAISYWNREQARIREASAQANPAPPPTPPSGS